PVQDPGSGVVLVVEPDHVRHSGRCDEVDLARPAAADLDAGRSERGEARARVEVERAPGDAAVDVEAEEAAPRRRPAVPHRHRLRVVLRVWLAGLCRGAYARGLERSRSRAERLAVRAAVALGPGG